MLIGQEMEDDFFDDYIEPKDYLPIRLNSTDCGMEQEGSEELAINNSSTLKGDHFLAKMEEVADVPVSAEEVKIASAGNLLQHNDGGISQNDREGISQVNGQPNNNLICNRLEIINHSYPYSLGKVKFLKN